MKKIIVLVLSLMVCVACKNEAKETEEVKEDVVEETAPEMAYMSIGKSITDDDAISTRRMLDHYSAMKVGDTVNAKMTGKITEVCAKKGCWMTLDMGNGETARVTFKDYGFFMPLDASGEVVINGKAFVSETSVEDLKHYAEDAGKSEEEIAAITVPQKTYGFEADGVLLKK
ncbi:DUF4920 domain-containing protein [Winogradskyella sp. A3E31]|uniref:DUF4920 domain-containing protein n=1 Tax=Winogradskyella sp. A3E31 TaxID=3349637 RepID=UPI00398A837A